MSINSSDPNNNEGVTETEGADLAGGDDGDDDQVVTLNADRGAASADEFADDGSEDTADEQREPSGEQERQMRRPTNSREVLLQFVPNRSERADEKLRSHLVGKIAIAVDGANENYLFEWQSGRATVREEQTENVECSIRLSEQNLMRVVAGELNPQVAMLSGKIQVQGNAEAAIYFFNLVAPKAHH